MTIKVNSFEPRLGPVGQEHPSRVASNPTDRADVASAMSSGTATQAEERSVALTPASRQLAEWLRDETSEAGVDAAKVARLRVEIEHGTYRLDSTRIAEGLLISERELLQRMDRG